MRFAPWIGMLGILISVGLAPRSLSGSEPPNRVNLTALSYFLSHFDRDLESLSAHVPSEKVSDINTYRRRLQHPLSRLSYLVTVEIASAAGDSGQFAEELKNAQAQAILEERELFSEIAELVTHASKDIAAQKVLVFREELLEVIQGSNPREFILPSRKTWESVYMLMERVLRVLPELQVLVANHQSESALEISLYELAATIVKARSRVLVSPDGAQAIWNQIAAQMSQLAELGKGSQSSEIRQQIKLFLTLSQLRVH